MELPPIVGGGVPDFLVNASAKMVSFAGKSFDKIITPMIKHPNITTGLVLASGVYVMNYADFRSFKDKYDEMKKNIRSDGKFYEMKKLQSCLKFIKGAFDSIITTPWQLLNGKIHITSNYKVDKTAKIDDIKESLKTFCRPTAIEVLLSSLLIYLLLTDQQKSN